MKNRFLTKAMWALVLTMLSVSIVLGSTDSFTTAHRKAKPTPVMISRQRELTSRATPRLVLKEEEVRYAVPLDDDLQRYAEALCEDSDIPLGVLYAMMAVESQFTADAVNDAGDIGLLQINNRYASAYGATDLKDPYQNIEVGTAILSGYLEEYPDDLERALMAYNCGPGRARELWTEGITSTQYTAKVRVAMADLILKREVVE